MPKKSLSILALTLFFLIACAQGDARPAAAEEPMPPPENTESAVFAGGCFWCMEPAFDHVDGVLSTTSGYAGGSIENPSYEQVSAGGTGHAEVVKVVFDPTRVSYEELLDVYWHNVDPTVKDQQFCDHGHQYRTAIFYASEAQGEAARASKAELEKTKPFDGPIVTEIEPLKAFYPAEEYHQDFYEKNPIRYKTYRLGCGRDARLRELWGDAAGGH